MHIPYAFVKFDSNIRKYSLHKTVTGFVCQKQWIISANHSFMYWQMLKGAGGVRLHWPEQYRPFRPLNPGFHQVLLKDNVSQLNCHHETQSKNFLSTIDVVVSFTLLVSGGISDNHHFIWCVVNIFMWGYFSYSKTLLLNDYESKINHFHYWMPPP